MVDQPPERGTEDAVADLTGPEIPDDYDDRVEAARAALDALPRDENWQTAMDAIANMPTSDEIERARAMAAEGLDLIARMRGANYTGHDVQGAVRVELDADGRLVTMEFGTAASGWNGRFLAAAIGEAWEDAESKRSEGLERFDAEAQRFDTP